jgi:quercetin dioxygenase-like cupin family protein
MAERFDKFTERARKVLQLAQEEAQRLNHSYIGSEHLLLGLVREGNGVAAKILAQLGVDLNMARNAVGLDVGHRGPSIAHVGLTDGAKRVIELAVEEARRLNHNYIGTEHLLLGLVREGDAITAAVLNSVGVSLENVRESVNVVVADPSGPERATARLQVARSQSGAPTARPSRATTNPWLNVGEQGSVVYAQLEAALAEMETANEEFGHRPLMTGPGYEYGLVRFLPRAEADERFITHRDKDVICQVMRGRGRLRLVAGQRELTVGDVCRVLAGTAHDFVAVDEPFVLLYTSIMVPEPRG